MKRAWWGTDRVAACGRNAMGSQMAKAARTFSVLGLVIGELGYADDQARHRRAWGTRAPFIVPPRQWDRLKQAGVTLKTVVDMVSPFIGRTCLLVMTTSGGALALSDAGRAALRELLRDL